MKIRSTILLSNLMQDANRPDLEPKGHFLGAKISSEKTQGGFFHQTSPLINFTGLQDFAIFLNRTANESDKDAALNTLKTRTGVAMSLSDAKNAAKLLNTIDQKTFAALAARDRADSQDKGRTLLSASEFEYLMALDGNAGNLSEKDITLFKATLV